MHYLHQSPVYELQYELILWFEEDSLDLQSTIFLKHDSTKSFALQYKVSLVTKKNEG